MLYAEDVVISNGRERGAKRAPPLLAMAISQRDVVPGPLRKSIPGTVSSRPLRLAIVGSIRVSFADSDEAGR
jgi:hypothetical protein